ncbi:MAG: PadR family transcriptional regulator [Thermoprotei archaeon]
MEDVHRRIRSFTQSIKAPNAVPRGLLMHYVLYTLSLKPMYAYEIMQDIDEKTEGAWRPGAGSMYPLLRKLLEEKMIEQTGTGKQRRYRLTEDGKKYVQYLSEKFATTGKRWNAARKIFMQMVPDSGLEALVVEAQKANLEVLRQTIESRLPRLDSSEIEYILGQHVMLVEHHLKWGQTLLSKLRHDRRKLVHVEKEAS